jgi:hypothetical protein
MAKMVTKTLNFPPSVSPDVVSYKLYIEESPNPINVDASPSYDLGNNTSVNLVDLIGRKEGTFNIGVASVDDKGNESDLSVLSDFPLDFVPPEPPGQLSVV